MTFSEQFKEIFELICDKIGVAIDWTQENIVPYVMDLCKRYVAYNIIETVLWILFSIALIIGVIILFRIIIKDRAKCNSLKKDTFWWDYYSYGAEAGFGAVFGFVFGSIFVIISIAMFCFGVSELLKWCFVPEFQLVEKISYLISTM
jgi:hypothetical protein